jgi:uncharacterized protein YoaH (UPF0181 family)
MRIERCSVTHRSSASPHHRSCSQQHTATTPCSHRAKLIDRDQVPAAVTLDVALAVGLSESEALATIASGLRAGHQHPRPACP